MTLSATEFGKRHCSCIMQDRIEFDEQYPGKGQAGFYASCQNGSYLLWQLCRVPEEQLLPHVAHLAEIAKRAAKRAEGYATSTDAYAYAYAHATDDYAVVYVVCAAATATHYAASCAALAKAANPAEADAARQKERQLQANDIHELIPAWPGE